MSDPKSDQYGKYKTPEEISKIISFPDSEIKNVLDQLHESGLECNIYRTKDAIRCSGTTQDISEIFSVSSFMKYNCIFTGKTKHDKKKK